MWPLAHSYYIGNLPLQGQKGDQGPIGPPGPKGEPGPAGESTTIPIGATVSHRYLVPPLLSLLAPLPRLIESGAERSEGQILSQPEKW